MGKTAVVAIRVSADLLERIDAATKNRSRFFIDAVEEKLNPVKQLELSSQEKRTVLKDAKTITEIMRDAMIQRLQTETGLLDSMPKEDFLKLVMARLPKESEPGADLEENVLSLKSCLDSLPNIEDITKELSRVKGELFKAERERDVNLKLLEHGKNKADLADLMGLLYRSVVEYVVNLIARRSLPGFGDGGGLTDKAYSDIAEEVRTELERLEIYRRKS